MKRNIGVLLIVAVLAGIAVFQSYSNANQGVVLPTEQAPKVNFLAPEFTLKGMDGETYSAGGARDKALLINFWASWCGPCHQEAPDLVRLHEKHGDRLDIYAINVSKMDSLSNAEEFVEEYQFKFPVLLDTENEVTSKYNIRAYPTNILVDTNGVIIEVFPSMLLPNDLKIIEKFLK
jgi:thiol-disulfide isomerase/thioredoxin